MVVTFAISGLFLAASRNLSTFAVRKGMSLPARSSRMKVMPPEVPMPGMAGGEKAMPRASDMPRSSSVILPLMNRYHSSILFRSDQSLSVTKKKALYVFATPLTRLYPATAVQYSTPGVFRMRSSAFFMAASVRWSEAASGSCMAAYT
ncbi:MAG: hypothetical protein BWX71_00751 [Deltaproteobacteria bacterium ADurb.Bin072]|nr:MAG: hypothetical protein BWX71_00751 [Deltaproteobacteria bacterium ADurb.Bin072]